jgi:hypothetical protein
LMLTSVLTGSAMHGDYRARHGPEKIARNLLTQQEILL